VQLSQAIDYKRFVNPFLALCETVGGVTAWLEEISTGRGVNSP
jgi:hypothetical protein